MPKIVEFRDVFDLNEYFSKNIMMHAWEVIPVHRQFTNPKTGLMTSTITYVLIMND